MAGDVHDEADLLDPATADEVEGLLAIAVDELGGSRRDGQVAMTRAVHEALSSGKHVAVQAGTGTGKSLAYLVPAIRSAMTDGGPVVVSTATIALQRQLVDRDLPRLAEALSGPLGRTPTFAILKGRNNYVCLDKLERTETADPHNNDTDQAEIINEAALSRQAAEVLRIREWARHTTTGDRDELVPGVSDRAWRMVSMTSKERAAAGPCPEGEECFAEQARRAASMVDVVVTNHSLLAIDAMTDAAVLPEHSKVIVDEAHELESRITGMATEELSRRAIANAATRAKKFGAEDQADRLNDANDAFHTLLHDLGDQVQCRWVELDPAVGNALAALRNALHATVTALQTSSQGEDADRQTVLAMCETLHDTCVRVLEQFEQDDPGAGPDVVWANEDQVLTVAPLSISGLLRERLFGESTVVLTSATLTLGGRFDAMAATWGLPKNSFTSLDVGSPFDPARSGILYVASDLPRPGREGTDPAMLDRMEQLITAAGGRTLGLFSSRRGAERAAEQLRQRLEMPILCQGEDTTGALVDQFAADAQTCLFGTLSLWQGVDVPGPALSLVMIDRIPFPRPDDPLSSARARAADNAGRNGFMEVSATHAALLLAQGAGRLLRSVDDRGVIAVLDPRLVTARYGPWLRKSMPPFWFTTNVQHALKPLERLNAAH
ncbi:ATP-dependent DNA helicase [Corynebacterium sp. TAE3-ERU12]|uniref:ATP-dependent DNA helicase n=1 Tax=Corynebacterium sp. TAE3-ERU12 TaxID=2849491 RepID=UPI00351D3DD7